MRQSSGCTGNTQHKAIMQNCNGFDCRDAHADAHADPHTTSRRPSVRVHPSRNTWTLHSNVNIVGHCSRFRISEICIGAMCHCCVCRRLCLYPYLIGEPFLVSACESVGGSMLLILFEIDSGNIVWSHVATFHLFLCLCENWVCIDLEFVI